MILHGSGADRLIEFQVLQIGLHQRSAGLEHCHERVLPQNSAVDHLVHGGGWGGRGHRSRRRGGRLLADSRRGCRRRTGLSDRRGGIQRGGGRRLVRRLLRAALSARSEQTTIIHFQVRITLILSIAARTGASKSQYAS